jgi:UDP-glucose 4-epimerase
VNDLAEAHVLGLEYLSKSNSVAMNLGTGQGYSVKQVVEAVEHITGHTVPTQIGARRPGDPAELVADPSVAERTLKWKAQRSLENIIATAWKWAQKRVR